VAFLTRSATGLCASHKNELLTKLVLPFSTNKQL